MTHPNEKALAALDRAITYGLASSVMNRPGAVISSLPWQDRAALQELSSKDAENHRPSLLQ